MRHANTLKRSVPKSRAALYARNLWSGCSNSISAYDLVSKRRTASYIACTSSLSSMCTLQFILGNDNIPTPRHFNWSIARLKIVVCGVVLGMRYTTNRHLQYASLRCDNRYLWGYTTGERLRNYSSRNELGYSSSNPRSGILCLGMYCTGPVFKPRSGVAFEAFSYKNLGIQLKIPASHYSQFRLLLLRLQQASRQ